MKITGNITCYDGSDLSQIQTRLGQTGIISCLDSADQFLSYGFAIRNTFWTSIDTTYIQNMELAIPSSLSMTFVERKFQGWTLVDGTYVDGTYTEPYFYNPSAISYGLYKNSPDGSTWNLIGYRFRNPINSDIGHYYATMILPNEIGRYKLEWLYQRNSTSDFTAVNQIFNVTNWDNNPYYAYFIIPPGDGTAPTDYTPYPKYTADFGDWIGNNWGLRWPQYLK
jgi:hypothetical protein